VEHEPAGAIATVLVAVVVAVNGGRVDGGAVDGGAVAGGAVAGAAVAGAGDEVLGAPPTDSSADPTVHAADAVPSTRTTTTTTGRGGRPRRGARCRPSPRWAPSLAGARPER